MKINKHAWLVVIPFHLLAIAGLAFVSEYIWYFLAFWFLFGIMGNGVAGHRYFAHQSFKVAPWLHHVLAYFTVMGAFAPPTYWVIQHSQHHRTSDTAADVHTPVKGLWTAFYGWLFNQQYVEFMLTNKSAVVRACVSRKVVFYERNYYQLLFGSLLLLTMFDWHLLLIYCAAYAAEIFRIGLVNGVCHRWGYRNHNTSDQSRNNILVGILGMGFGWHNNHHASPGKLVLTEHWWEIDVEGYIGWLLSHTAKKS